MIDSFQKRHLDLIFNLGKGQFGQSGSSEVRLAGHRVSATIQTYGGLFGSEAQIRVFGMRQSEMNTLTQLYRVANTEGGRLNTVTLLSRSGQEKAQIAFKGVIVQAWQDLSGMPETCMTIVAQPNAFMIMKAAPAISFRGPVKVADIVKKILTSCDPDYKLVNDGVNAILTDVSAPGDAASQLDELANAVPFQRYFDGVTYWIWPTDRPLSGNAALVSSETGLIGYPSWTGNGISFSTIYNRSISFGRMVNLQTDITPFNGSWAIVSKIDNLESEVIGGMWMSQIEAQILPGMLKAGP